MKQNNRGAVSGERQASAVIKKCLKQAAGNPKNSKNLWFCSTRKDMAVIEKMKAGLSKCVQYAIA
jgi:hypothetical protein